jgi:hypothetical protein
VVKSLAGSVAACAVLLGGCGTSSSGTTQPGLDSGSPASDAIAEMSPDSPSSAGPDSGVLLLDAGNDVPDAGSSAHDASSPPDAAGAGTLQGLYESCQPSDPTCAPRLDAMAAAGFRLVLNYAQEGGSAAQQIAYLDHAKSLGMKVIWSFSDSTWYDGTADLRTTYPALAAQCNCTDNTSFIAYLVGLVKDHPALWGYYVADEPPAAQQAAVAAFSDQVHTLDPAHPRLIVANADATLLQPFADNADALGLDIYPIQDYPTSQQCIAAVGQLGPMGAALAMQHARTWSMVLQAFSWSQYPQDYTPCCGTRWPTRAEMRGMRDQALQSSPSVLLWFSYFNVQSSDDPAGHWADLTWAATGP